MPDAPLKKKFLKTWGGVGILLGAGLLPCPDCGAPMISHFWPLAALLTLRNILRKRLASLKKQEKVQEEEK